MKMHGDLERALLAAFGLGLWVEAFPEPREVWLSGTARRGRVRAALALTAIVQVRVAVAVATCAAARTTHNGTAAAATTITTASSSTSTASTSAVVARRGGWRGSGRGARSSGRGSCALRRAGNKRGGGEWERPHRDGNGKSEGGGG